MSSIRQKLLLAFSVIIISLLIADVFLIGSNIVILRQQREVSDNIFLQFRLIGTSSELIKSYNDFRNIPSEENLEKYHAINREIASILARLEETIVTNNSRNILKGVASTISSLIGETNAGLDTIAAGDIVNTSSHYAEANRKFNFVRENTTSLILSELEFAQTLDANIQKTQQQTIYLGVGILGSLIIAAFIFSLVFSRRLVVPLIRLSALAKQVSEGKLDVSVDKNLLESNDEVGSLSKSFSIMLTNLQSNVKVLEESNKQLEASNDKIGKAQAEVSEKNAELERLNKQFVNRELKMIELKDRVKQLEGGSSSPLTPSESPVSEAQKS